MTLTFRKHPHYPDLLFGADGFVIRADKLRPTDILMQKNDRDPLRLRKTVKLSQLVSAKEMLKEGVRVIGKTIDGTYRQRPVAELILEAWDRPKPDAHHPAFKDGDRSNLSLDNLHWTPAPLKALKRRAGDGHQRSSPKRPTFDRDAISALAANGMRYMEIAAIMGCSGGTVFRALRSKGLIPPLNKTHVPEGPEVSF